MNETITLSKETYDQLMYDRYQYHYLCDAIRNGYKTHDGDYERAVFVFHRQFGDPMSIAAESENETIIELNDINKGLKENFENKKKEFKERLANQPIFKHLFLNLYIKQ